MGACLGKPGSGGAGGGDAVSAEEAARREVYGPGGGTTFGEVRCAAPVGGGSCGWQCVRGCVICMCCACWSAASGCE